MRVHRPGVIALAVLAGLGLTGGCTAGPDRPPPHLSTALCQATDLGVSVDRFGVLVVNKSRSACRFAGTYPVVMQVPGFYGPPPPAARGILPPGRRYVQPYLVGAAKACPPPVARKGVTADVGVLVENRSLSIPVSVETAYEITTCLSFSAGVPYIQL